jgi:hypothetical protein
MLISMRPEDFDPDFLGQDLTTAYFDTKDFDLRKARNRGDYYLTLRLRCYQPSGVYALSAKTEEGKYRVTIDHDSADFLLSGQADQGVAAFLPTDLQNRLQTLTQGKPLLPVTAICFRRYAVENTADRFTLDTAIRTDAGKRFWTNVLEFKSTQSENVVPEVFQGLKLRPIKLSKFLWATRM